jgi:hypothetical protein
MSRAVRIFVPQLLAQRVSAIRKVLASIAYILFGYLRIIFPILTKPAAASGTFCLGRFGLELSNLGWAELRGATENDNGEKHDESPFHKAWITQSHEQRQA